MIRHWYTRIHDIFATAEAMDSDLGALPEDPLVEYDVIADTRDPHRLYTICAAIIIVSCFAPVAVWAWVVTH